MSVLTQILNLYLLFSNFWTMTTVLLTSGFTFQLPNFIILKDVYSSQHQAEKCITYILGYHEHANVSQKSIKEKWAYMSFKF